MYIVPQVASNTIYFALQLVISAAHLRRGRYFVVSDATALQCHDAELGGGDDRSRQHRQCNVARLWRRVRSDQWQLRQRFVPA